MVTFGRRDWRPPVLRDCRDPGQGWVNWSARDEGFATHVASEARRRGYSVITIDGSRGADAILAEVELKLGWREPDGRVWKRYSRRVKGFNVMLDSCGCRRIFSIALPLAPPSINSFR